VGVGCWVLGEFEFKIDLQFAIPPLCASYQALFTG